MTGLLTTCGREFEDWSAPYRLFSCDRFPADPVFSVIRHAVLSELPAQAPFSVALDDTLLRKTGTRIPGVAWRRDPLGPKFQTNFIRAQRFLQFSASIPLSDHAYRMVPIALHHAPTPVKPSPKASSEEQQKYRKQARLAALPRVAAEKITALRQSLDADPSGAQRPLHLFADGGYTNQNVLKHLPPRTTLVGRIRQDAKLYFFPDPPQASKRRGRPLHYGLPAPTPEQLRTDESIPWTSLQVFISGIPHPMRMKRLSNLLWRAAGLKLTLQLVVIAPLAYRLRKGSKLLYRKPAFLICTDPELDLQALVGGFIQRWDIEVNFREEKTLLGVGQAQVRNADSVNDLPALQVASYAMLLLASLRSFRSGSHSDLLPPPKWAARANSHRFSTPRAINQLRAEVWGQVLHLDNFSGFVATHTPITKPQKLLPDLKSAVLYAMN